MNINYTDWSRWTHITSINPVNFICGYCGTKVGTTHGYNNPHKGHKIYICTHCGLPTLKYGNIQVPGPDLSLQFKNLPEDIDAVYKEIASSIQNFNYTAAVMLSRKLIMHIAVEQGADEGKTFAEYVQFMKDAGYIPPNAGRLLTFIRQVGNQKNHEIVLSEPEEAKKVLKFVESILQFAYELAEEFEDEEKT